MFDIYRSLLLLFVFIAVYVIVSGDLAREEDIGEIKTDFILVRALSSDCFGDGFNINLENFVQSRLDTCMEVEDKYGVKFSLYENKDEIKKVFINEDIIKVRLSSCENTKSIDCFYRYIGVVSDGKLYRLVLEVVRER